MGIGNLKKKDVWEKSMSLGYKGNERLAHQRNLGKGRKEFPFILNGERYFCWYQFYINLTWFTRRSTTDKGRRITVRDCDEFQECEGELHADLAFKLSSIAATHLSTKFITEDRSFLCSEDENVGKSQKSKKNRFSVNL